MERGVTAAAGDRWTCERCGVKFARQKSGNRPIRFCSQQCYQAQNKGNKGSFANGAKPWNKGKKGVRLSPRTEFVKGQRGINWLPVGSQTVRTDKNGTYRVFVKIAEPNQWRERSIMVWEMKNKTDRGDMVIHHVDHDALNDRPSNLKAVSRADHINIHRFVDLQPERIKPEQEAML